MLYSILIPAFKTQYLNECIESVLSQTYSDFELVIVNDASPENLDVVVNGFSDPRIHYYKNEIGFGAEHVVGNWNRCLELAKGDYVICMGDDDKLMPTCLEQYKQLIEKYPNLDVYHARFDLIDENSQIHRVNYVDKRDEYESTYDLLKNRFNGRYQFIGDYLFRTSFLREKGGFVDFPCAWFSDEISVAMCAGKKGIANTQKVGFCYRISDRTISNNTKMTDLKLDAADFAKEWYSSFISNNEGFNNYQREKLNKMMHSRIKKSKNACIAYDMSFHLISGYEKWKSQITKGELLIIWLYALRLKVGRLLHRLQLFFIRVK